MSPSVVDVLLAYVVPLSILLPLRCSWCGSEGSQAHAVAYEHHRALISNVIILPSSFGRTLLGSLPGGGSAPAPSPDLVEAVQSAQNEIRPYPTRQIWKSSMLLIPLRLQYQWVLVAVTNLFEAVSRDYVGPRVHDVLPGDSKPDRAPFSILVLNSSRLKKNKLCTEIHRRVSAFLELSWEHYRGTKLEYVDLFSVKVCASDSIDRIQPLSHLSILFTVPRARGIGRLWPACGPQR